MLNKIIWFAQDHPIFCVILVFIVAIIIFQNRGERRSYEQKMDSYSPGWWRRKQEREYQASRDEARLLIIVAIILVVIVYNVFIK